MVVQPVLSSGTGMIVSEGKTGTDRALLRLMRRLEMKGFVVAPVKGPTAAIGIMAAATPLDGRDLQDGDLKLLSVLANFAAIALENAALVGHLDKKARQLIVDRATVLMGATSGSVIRMDPGSGTLFIEAERGLGPEVKNALRLRVGEGITGWVAREGEPLLVPDVRKDPRYIQANPAVLSEMAVPVKWGSEVMGVINLDHYQVGGFAEEDLELLTAFGNAAAVALRNANALCGWPRKADPGTE
jgi:GAF domain-containing protein